MVFKLSCHSWSFNDLTTVEAFGTIARLGFRHVDIGSGAHLNLVRAGNPATRKQAINELQADLQLFNLSIADFQFMLPRISLSDEKKRLTDVGLFKALCGFVQDIGVQGVTITSGAFHAEDDEEAIDRTVNSLSQMLSFAQEANIALSIEPQMDSMAQTPEQALFYVQKVDGLQLTLDWSWVTYQKVKKQLPNLLQYTRHIHMRQATTKRIQTPFERGKIDIDATLQTLYDADYDGYITIEYLQTKDWHGLQRVDSIDEVLLMRDALRDVRDALPPRPIISEDDLDG